MKLTVYLLSLMLICPVMVFGAVIHVPADQATIQAAVNAAETGDTVILADGTYSGDGNREIAITRKEITITSAGGPENCVMDCGGLNRGFLIWGPVSGGLVINGLTVTNGHYDCTS